mgnify:CR=1 FL=1
MRKAFLMHNVQALQDLKYDIFSIMFRNDGSIMQVRPQVSKREILQSKIDATLCIEPPKGFGKEWSEL